MQDLLAQANLEVEKHAEHGKLPPEIIMQIEQTYSQILEEGFAHHSFLPPLPVPEGKKRGGQRQREGKNLLNRLKPTFRGLSCACIYFFKRWAKDPQNMSSHWIDIQNNLFGSIQGTIY